MTIQFYNISIIQFKKLPMATSLIKMIHMLPEGVVGHVLTYIPRNDTAQLIVDAANEDKLSLTYLRKFQVVNEKYKEQLYKDIAPSVLGKNTYGDDDAPYMIIRSKISMGEMIRMRNIANYSEWFRRSNL